MTKLTRSDFERARAFIYSKGRPLDRSLFEYHFESESADGVKEELGRFQNEDGGFGRSLEPDFRLGSSSPLATTVAFQVLREIGAASDDELARTGIGYLLSAYDTQNRRWWSTPREVNDEPHAPWWHHDGDRGNSIDRSGWGNPSAEIVGYLREHGSLVPEDFLAEVTDLALSDVRSLPEEIDVHMMMCYLRLADTLPDREKSLVLGRLERSAKLGISGAPDDWPGVGASLLPFAPSPDSPLAGVLSAPMASRLDREIERQEEDGSWEPVWSWGQYEEAWQSAKVEWQGRIALETLLALRAYGRIEGV